VTALATGATLGTAVLRDSGRQRHRRRVDWRALAREVPVVAFAFVLYWWARGLTEGSAAEAVRNARRLVDLERSLSIYWEPALQDRILGHDWIVTLANWVYIWGHWPVILCVAIWMVLRHRSAYRVVRNAFLISGAIGLCIFVLFPMAPPRLAGLDLADTVTLHSHAYRVLQPPSFTNQYAAMPSLHFGWDLLVGGALILHARRLPLRMLGVALPVAMLLAIVLTANHFILDAVAGAVVALTGLGLALLLRRAAGHVPGPRRLVRMMTGAPAA
jgi:hypothetical protein